MDELIHIPRSGILNREILLSHTDTLLETVPDYREMLMEYSGAMRTIRTKLEILDSEFSLKCRHNPVISIQTRLKSQSSIMAKMARLGIPVNLKPIEENLNDIAGLRVVCPYLDDIYMIADALIQQEDIELIQKKDYIDTPKPNGYRSLHLIVRVPVGLSDGHKRVKAEIQIRTIAMDFWGSLEHQIKYKKDSGDTGNIVERLKACADIIAFTDKEMQAIRMEMDKQAK